ncbi:MAG: DUF3192 domain-containing protein [Chlamydiales bacterium]|nr:DUF3192 domain-containing protein [Chlamydiales bacterium]
MKRFGFFLLASGLFWTGCIENDSLSTASIAQRNVENLARLSAGMSSKQVFQIMRKPYRNEKFDVDEDHYEIWFYITNLTLLEQETLTHKNLTPITFKNEVLLGKGYHAYYKALSQKNAEIEAGNESREDDDLEKVLNKPSKPAPGKGPPSGATKPQNAPSNPSGGDNKQQGQKNVSPSQTKKTTPTTPQGANKPNQPSQNKKPPPQTTPPAGNAVTMSKASSSNPPPPEPPPENTDNKKVPLTEEDERVIHEEQEENFDFW